jgi:mRNA-degrading endonuclease toxin of MazEF toxin-antitoxin module
MRGFSQVARGQIWWLSPNAEGQLNSCIERKTRPYVVVSTDQFNQGAPIVTVVPLTTRKFDNREYHIPVICAGEKALVLCEHIYTVSVKSFKPSAYIGVFSQDVMEKISQAVAKHLDLVTYIPGYNDVEDLIEQILDKSVSEFKDQITEEKVLAVCAKISQVFNLGNQCSPGFTQHSRGHRWSDEEKDQFIRDCESLPLSQVCSKYSYSTESSVQSRYYYLKKRRR